MERVHANDHTATNLILRKPIMYTHRVFDQHKKLSGIFKSKYCRFFFFGGSTMVCEAPLYAMP